jgi:hypothetical protein
VEEVKAASLLFATLFFSNGIIFSQTICVGTTEQCVQAQKKLCAEEPVPANLILETPAEIAGVVKDQSGAYFSQSESVQLRDGSTGVVLRTAELTHDGHFSFGRTDRGRYRLIVVRHNKSKAIRLMGFDQPRELKCQSGQTCELVVIPTVHSTDNPIDSCEPK